MGQYLQGGICYRLSVPKQSMVSRQVTVDQVVEALSKEMDMWLYKYEETNSDVIFFLDEAVFAQQLPDFLRFHYSMYVQEEPYLSDFEAVLMKLSQVKSIEEIIQMAEERRYPCFQKNVVNHRIEISPWNWLRAEVSMIVFLAEGTILMEASENFLRYLENLIQTGSQKWSISGAFRCFIE